MLSNEIRQQLHTEYFLDLSARNRLDHRPGDWNQQRDKWSGLGFEAYVSMTGEKALADLPPDDLAAALDDFLSGLWHWMTARRLNVPAAVLMSLDSFKADVASELADLESGGEYKCPMCNNVVDEFNRYFQFCSATCAWLEPDEDEDDPVTIRARERLKG